MTRPGTFQDTALPSHWPTFVKWAVLETISLAYRVITYSRSFAVNSTIERIRLKAQLDEANTEIALLREEIRIKDARMARISAKRRPFYPPQERMAILELKAARAWNLADVARTFMVEPETVSSWMDRAGAEDDGLLRTSEPVNKYPDYVRYIVQRLKTLCPIMGKRQIAQILARAGLHLGATTVWRILKEEPLPAKPDLMGKEAKATDHVVTAKYPNHVWHIDMTTVPTMGFWAPWWPFCLSQVWPFAWWVVVILDHFSRVVVGFAVFPKQPTSREVRDVIAMTIQRVGKAPKYLISDQGKQFTAKRFKKWCRNHRPRKIRQRFGAVGQYGSIALIERAIRSLKYECARRIIVPLRADDMCRELTLFFDWYNQYRPHQGLDGRIPMDVYLGIRDGPPEIETRGRDPVRPRLRVTYLDGRRHLPVVRLEQAA